mmetsp:Transcript_1036/g.3228  ORF Transcript_1036/g.3228 Transcript_1036/m.3228 type:complete len:244 (-) Transcript_1036:902-1633(-)
MGMTRGPVFRCTGARSVDVLHPERRRLRVVWSMGRVCSVPITLLKASATSGRWPCMRSCGGIHISTVSALHRRGTREVSLTRRDVRISPFSPRTSAWFTHTRRRYPVHICLRRPTSVPARIKVRCSAVTAQWLVSILPHASSKTLPVRSSPHPHPKPPTVQLHCVMSSWRSMSLVSSSTVQGLVSVRVEAPVGNWTMPTDLRKNIRLSLSASRGLTTSMSEIISGEMTPREDRSCDGRLAAER